MFEESISQETKRVLEKLGESELTKNFYLAGGTALAIQLGHRESIDLDWFFSSDFSTSVLKEKLADLGNFEITAEETGTLHGVMNGVKLSFLHYKYKLLFDKLKFGKVDLADEKDIAAMKISAVSSRGSKKDFIDIYFLLQKYSLNEIVNFFEEKFINVKYNKAHILKSLVFFEDAEKDPMPKMLKEVSWEEAKKFIQNEVETLLNKEAGIED